MAWYRSSMQNICAKFQQSTVNNLEAIRKCQPWLILGRTYGNVAYIRTDANCGDYVSLFAKRLDKKQGEKEKP